MTDFLPVDGFKPDSSNVSVVVYIDNGQRMRVTFKNEITYEYKDVPKELYLEFKEAESAGKFLAEKVKGQFRYERLTEI